MPEAVKNIYHENEWGSRSIGDKCDIRTSYVHSEDILRGLSGGVPEFP